MAPQEAAEPSASGGAGGPPANGGGLTPMGIEGSGRAGAGPGRRKSEAAEVVVEVGTVGSPKRPRRSEIRLSRISSGSDSPRIEVKASRTKKVRAYTRWPGNASFLCKGRLVSGPNWTSVLGTACLILLPNIAFVITVTKPLWDKASLAFFVVSLVWPLVCVAFLLVAAFMDPGIIPRSPEPNEDWMAGRLPRTKEVDLNGHKVLVRYNETCHFYQPPRAHHCSVMDECIEKFDHYCPWVGTTVGQRNYRFFLLFIFCTTALCIYVFGCSAYLVKLEFDELRVDNPDALIAEALRNQPGAIVMMIYTFLLVFFVGGLSSLHIFLVSTNQTTYENFRYSYDQDNRNPYNKGCLGNWYEVFCLPIPPSKCDFRAVVEEVAVG